MMPPTDSMHQNTAPNTTTMRNRKYVSADGYFEAVYAYNGKLLKEGDGDIDMGTYNYFPSTKKSTDSKSNIILKALDTLVAYIGHTADDIIPYEIYRNSKQDLKEYLVKVGEEYKKQYERIESR